MMRQFFRRLLSRFRRPKPKQPRIRSFLPLGLYSGGEIREMTEEDLRPRRLKRLTYWQRRKIERGYFISRHHKWDGDR